MLTFDDVLNIHNVLVEDFAKTPDPVDPPGLRDDGALLHSAVSRQHVGLGSELKYPDPLSNAATLCYGVCCNHAFHNGNKRTALVALLCHLDQSGLMLKEAVTQDELYSFILKIAAHKFAPKKHQSDSSDIEVREITRWLHRNTRQIRKEERVITFRELRQILREYDVELENPKGNYIDVVKYEMKRRRIFAKKERIGTRVAHIPYPREGQEVGRKVLRSIREQCSLTEKDGVDSEMFYKAEIPVDKFITRYKRTLRRLAKV
ncbi:Fic family protein [Metallibacterium sp.]|uniref:Fic family protein n=1 Tax=Metallibacterium sp. TaxID=2940281 RepID=UPI002604F996|nr:Fic family protein [Metallibacterium sp.]